MQASGLSVLAAGNISPAALTALMGALDADDLPQVWVLELSSFQLETTHTLMADAAVVLNVTQDHLDWHGGMDAYAAAKARLLKMARIAIVNRDDPYTVDMVPVSYTHLDVYKRQPLPGATSNRHACGFRVAKGGSVQACG